MTDQALFLWRVFSGQRNSLRVVTNYAALFNLYSVVTFLHSLIKGSMFVVRGDLLSFFMGGTHNENCDYNGESCNG